MQVEVSKIVAARPPDIFDTVTDVTSWPETVRSIASVEILSDGPVQPGARLRLRRVMFGHETFEELEVFDMERPRRFRLTGETRGLHYERDHIADAVADEGTRFMLIFRTRPESDTGRALLDFITPLMQVNMRDELERDLFDLAAAAARAPQPAQR
jgi:hypothetical protein